MNMLHRLARGSKKTEAAYTSLSSRSLTPRPYPAAHAREPRHVYENEQPFPVSAIPMDDITFDTENREESPAAASSPLPVGTTPAPVSDLTTTPASPSKPVSSIGQLSPTKTDALPFVNPVNPSKTFIAKVQNVERIVKEGRARVAATNAVPVTSYELEALGIHRIGLGIDDTNRINAVNSSIVVYNGPLDDTKMEEKGLSLTYNYPSHIIDTVILVSTNTAQCQASVSLSLNAYSDIRTEVNRDYKFAGDYVLKTAVKNHREMAYAGYVKILSVHNNIDKMSAKRGVSIQNWVYTLRDEVARAGLVAKFIEEAKKEAWLAKLYEQKITPVPAAKQNSGDDQDEFPEEV